MTLRQRTLAPLCALGFLIALAPSAARAQSEVVDPREPVYQEGPLTAAIGDIAEIELGGAYLFFDAPNTAKLMELMENPAGGNELAVVMPKDNGGWFIVFQFDEIGYVPDDEKDELDADAMLESMIAGAEASNEQRRARGWSEYNLIGWTEKPHYDERTNNLSWTLEGESEGHRNLNRMVKLLGRHGVMTATLVSSPDHMNVATVATNDLLDQFHYSAGNTYAEYEAGSDKLAQYGLTALVVGGAGAALAKSGLLAKMWKPIAAVLVAFGAGIKRFFSNGRSSDHDPTKPIG